MIMRKYIGKTMMNKLQEYIKWAREQMFKTNPPKEQHLEHIPVVEAKPVKPKRVVVRKKKDVNS